MSITAISAALRATTTPTGEQLATSRMITLHALATFTSERTHECYPALATMMRHTGLSKNTLRAAFADLESYGWLTRRLRSGSSTAYRLNIDAIAASNRREREPEENEPALIETPAPAAPAQPAPKKPRNLYSEDFEAFWKDWPSERKVDKSRAARAYAAAVKAGTPPEVINAACAAHLARYNEVQKPAHLIPHPTTWLHRHRWETDPATITDDRDMQARSWEDAVQDMARNAGYTGQPAQALTADPWGAAPMREVGA